MSSSILKIQNTNKNFINFVSLFKILITISILINQIKPVDSITNIIENNLEFLTISKNIEKKNIKQELISGLISEKTDVLNNLDLSEVNQELKNKNINPSNPSMETSLNKPFDQQPDKIISISEKNPNLDNQIIIPSPTMIDASVVSEKIIPENRVYSFFKTIFSGFSVIILAEIGDKTFFLVMIFSTTNSFWSTLIVASSVMLSWNFVCLWIGSSIPVLLFKGFLDILAMFIFFFFGCTMIYSAYQMEHELLHKGLNDTKSELSRKSGSRKSVNLQKEEMNKQNLIYDSEELREPLMDNKEEEEEFEGFHSNWAFGSSLAIAEFGDKTQISSIILGSTQNFYGILIGTSLARIGGVLIAVIFGKILANNVTTKQVTYLGGSIFLFFSFVYLFKMF